MTSDPEIQAESPETAPEPEPQPLIQGDKGIEIAQVWISAFCVLFVAILAYSNAFGIPWHHRDQLVIRDNPAVHGITRLEAGEQGPRLGPLSQLTIASTWSLFGNNPIPFHLFNILLHGLNGVLVYFIARRLWGKPGQEILPMAGGLVFVVHPLATEAVNYVAYRGYLLAAFFGLLALVLFLRNVDDERSLPIGVFVAYFLAWTAHPGAWIVPLLLMGAHYVYDRQAPTPHLSLLSKGGPRTWWIHGYFLGAMVALGAVWLVWQQEALHFAVEGLRAQSAALAQQCTKIFWPLNLSVAVGDVSVSYVPLILVAALVVAIVLLRFVPVVGLPAFWWVVTLAGLATAVAPGDVLREARMYWPLAGVALVIPGVLRLLPSGAGRVAGGVAAAALVLALGVATFQRNQVWGSELTLWSDALESQPESAEVHRILGRVYLEQAAEILAEDPPAAEPFLEQSLQHYSRAQELGSDGANVQFHRGRVLQLQGDRDRAMAHYESALMDDPYHRRSLLMLATLYEERGRQTNDQRALRTALELYGKADQLEPLSADVLFRYSDLLARTGEFAESLRALQRLPAEAETARLEQLRNARGQSYQQIRGLEEQIYNLTFANPADPAIAQAQGRLHFLRRQHRHTAYALADFMDRGEADVQTWALLGAVHGALQSPETFLTRWPDPPGAYDNEAWAQLAQICGATNQWDAARTYMESAAAEDSLDQPPLMLLGQLAARMGQLQRAEFYFRDAADALSGSPEPWLALAQIALAQDNRDAAQSHLARAEENGADPEDIQAVREGAGLAEPSEEPVRTIIR